MIVDVTPENFSYYLNDIRQGYLVNIWPSPRRALAHALTHLHGACRAMLAPTKDYPKYYASSLEEATRHAETLQLTCVECGLCKRRAPKD